VTTDHSATIAHVHGREGTEAHLLIYRCFVLVNQILNKDFSVSDPSSNRPVQVERPHRQKGIENARYRHPRGPGDFRASWRLFSPYASGLCRTLSAPKTLPRQPRAGFAKKAQWFRMLSQIGLAKEAAASERAEKGSCPNAQQKPLVCLGFLGEALNRRRRVSPSTSCS
jgi:hypothetical protein